MTATTVDDRPFVGVRDVTAPATALTTPVGRSPNRLLQWAAGWPSVAAGSALGTVVIGLSYRFSTLGYPADLYYVVFWAGMLLACAPAAARLIADSTPRRTRLGMILLLGVMTAMPKYLRNPFNPSYHDEYAHWREAIDVAVTGRLFQPNTTIPIVEFFPGTSALTVSAHSFTGTSLWTSGVLVVLMMHVLGLFAVYLLGEELLGSSRAGAVAAVVYSVNPSAIYFDTQYAYESIAINFFLWTIALTALAAGTRSKGARFARLAAAVASAAGCVVTHHLTTIFLVVALSVVVMAATVRARFLGRAARGRHRAATVLRALNHRPAKPIHPWWITLVSTVAIATAWVTSVARPTLDYLSPYLGSSLSQLNTMTRQSGQGKRALLAASVEPEWERWLTAAAPLALSVVFVAAVLLIRRRRVVIDSATWGLMLFGAAYFLSLPFILAPSGAEGARRSWGFTYLGVALIVAMVVVFWPAERPSWLGRSLRTPLTAALMLVLLIGNVGGGLNDPYRFPGPFRWGTDTNSASAEARSIARELGSVVGRSGVVSDAYTALQLAAYGGLVVAAPSPGFPAWDLVQRDADPSPELARMLVSSRYDYLVVDTRMSEEDPYNGHNFGKDDPLLGHATPRTYLVRLDHVPWARRVMSTEHLRVYRLDLAAIAARRD
jgi:hypothetical protein